MAELQFLVPEQPRGSIGLSLIRIAAGLVFVVFGAEKFSLRSQWVDFFRQVGAGDWFRYFTGVVEVLGGLLLLVPRTATAGLALLCCTMAGAMIVVGFVLGHPADMLFPGVFLVGLIVLAWNRRRG